MEYIKDNLVKSNGIYICPDNIKNFKIRLRIKKESIQSNKKTQPQYFIEKELYWQEKVFSRNQKEYYSDERNCFTDKEREYNRIIWEESGADDNNLLSTYCDDDKFCPENQLIQNNINYLERTLHNLNITLPSSNLKEYDLVTSIRNSIQYPVIKEHWEFMYVMGDFGYYFEDTWVKKEILLCTIKYNQANKTLQIFPDFTNSAPYVLKIQGDRERVFSYFIENCSNIIPESIEANEKTLIKKIHNLRAHTKAPNLDSTFELPPKNKFYIFVFMEICSGRRFEYPDVYVEYSFHLPEGWSTSTEERLKGRTNFCRANHDNGLVHFGHCMEISLEYNVMDLERTEYTKSASIYFEVISKDSWDRYRTEGLCYVNLPISQSGTFKYNLRCLRFTGAGPVNEMMRFFIGDCRNYTNVDCIGIPNSHQHNSLNKFGTHTVNTGKLAVKFHLLHQSQEFVGVAKEVAQMRKNIFDKLGSSTLVKSVEEVILEFKKARKEMLEARKNV
ncbi:tectonic-like complex member MKS1 isoform X2 [Euwallacea fornicatus]|uniref:tectonic-like complex member MKS1 isoform X2 n=1 Tax=Euwallacea fornicatus TaxID=995702 RepID=UPI00338F6FA3